MRTPVAWCTALAIAAAVPTMPSSPMPLEPIGVGVGVHFVQPVNLDHPDVGVGGDVAGGEVVGVVGHLGDLQLLDELGYVQLDLRGAEMQFQIITERDKKASIGIGTNLPFSEWGTVFPDPRLVAAIVDRGRLQRPHPRDRHPVLPARHQ